MKYLFLVIAHIITGEWLCGSRPANTYFSCIGFIVLETRMFLCEIYKNRPNLHNLQKSETLQISLNICLATISGLNYRNFANFKSFSISMQHRHIMYIQGVNYCCLAQNELCYDENKLYSMKQQSAGRHDAALGHIYPDSELTSLCSHSLMVCAWWSSSKNQCNCHWFDPTDARTIRFKLAATFYQPDRYQPLFSSSQIASNHILAASSIAAIF